jgi:arylsulfatase A-like enzyme
MALVRRTARNRILRSFATVAIAMALLTVGMAMTPASGRSATGSSRALVRPNIILVVTDDQSITSLRYPTMPYFRSILTDPTQRWTTFRRAFDNNPLCCPSRATMLTGQYSHHNGVWCVGTGPNCGEALAEHHTIATWLHKAGYTTGLFGKYLNYYPFDRGNYTPPGWDDWHAFTGAGGGTYYNYHMVVNGRLVHYGSAPQDHSTVVVGNAATRFVSRARHPFFAYIATSSPHEHWTAEPSHVGAFDGQRVWHSPAFDEKDVSDKPTWVRRLPRINRAKENRNQQSELASLLDVDSMLQQVFRAVRARGMWNNTVVIYISDNGYSYGAHRWEGKRCPYEECVGIPLFIRDPHGGVTHTARDLVSNVDIAPTIARLAGVTPDIREDGRSLLPLVKDQRVKWGQNHGLLMEFRTDTKLLPSWWAVRTPRFMYDELATGERELYHLSSDPYETSNVIKWPRYRRVRARLHCRLLRLRGDSC